MLRAWKSIAVMTVMALLLSFAAVAVPLAKPVEADPGWWDDDWNYKLKLTIDHFDVGSSLSGFPVLVHLSNSSGINNANLSDIFGAKTQDNGEDIRFVNAAETGTYPYEIEEWNEFTSEAWIWVYIPSISPSTDTVFYMYYGNPSAPPGQSPTSVWDSGFSMVQHLQETSGTHEDSTSNNNDGTCSGSMDQDVPGLVDGADDLDGSDDYITVADHSSFDQNYVTVEALVNGDSYSSGWHSLINRGVTGDQYPLVAEWDGNTFYFRINAAGNFVSYDFPSWNTGQWYYLALTYGGGYLRIYRDGQFEAVSIYYPGPMASCNDGYRIGTWDTTPTELFDGQIDEVRISNVDRGSNWIEAQYESMTDDFITYDRTGYITICKDTIPESDPAGTDWFDFTSDIPGHLAFSLEDDGVPCEDCYSSIQLPGGIYIISETQPTGWDLVDVSFDEVFTAEGTELSLWDWTDHTATIWLEPGEHVHVTFTNQERGTIIVEKHTRGGAKGSFTFTGDVAGTIGGGGQLEEDNLVPGKYTVRERIPTGWELSSIRCDDNNSSGSVGTGTATINLEPGETVTCTYTNTYLAGTPGLPRKHPGAVGTPEPASVLACYLDVPVVEALPGQQFDISVNLCNRGGEKATKSVDLLINGHQEQSQTVGLGPGACQTVVFRVFKTVPGTYEVSIMGQVGYFTIMPLYPGYVVREAPPQQAGGIGTAGIVTIVIVLIVLGVGLVLILRRE